MCMLNIIEHVIELSISRREAKKNDPQPTQDFSADPWPEPSADQHASLDDYIYGWTPGDIALRDYLATLDNNSIYLLTMIMYIGRGDIGVRNLSDDIAGLICKFPDPDRARGQIASKTPLDEYLGDGLKRLLKANVDVNVLPHELFENPVGVM